MSTSTRLNKELEVVIKANNSRFGLYAFIFAADVSRPMWLAKAMEASTLGNNYMSTTTAFDLPISRADSAVRPMVLDEQLPRD